MFLFQHQKSHVSKMYEQEAIDTMMANSHCTGTGAGQVQGQTWIKSSNILFRNVHTGPQQGKEPRPIVSYLIGALIILLDSYSINFEYDRESRNTKV